MAATDTQSKPEDLLKRVKNDTKQWADYFAPYAKKHAQYWKLWNNKRTKTQYHGDSDSFDPMTHQMVESNVDNVYSSRPKMAFLPRDRHQETDTKILNGMWDRNWDDNNMDYYLPIMGREATITGNMVAFCCREDGPNGTIMRIEHFPLGDCILDATARDQFTVTKAGYRRLVSLDELKDAKRFDAAKGWVDRYHDLDKVKAYGNGDEKTEKALKDMLAGSTLNEEGKKGLVLVTYMIYLDKVVEVANETTVIYSEDSPYHKDEHEVVVQDLTDEGEPLFDENAVPPGAETLPPEQLQQVVPPVEKPITVPAIEPFIPIAMHGGYKDGALLLSKGDVETFADTQEDLNDALNLKKDNIALAVKSVGIFNSNQVTPEEAEELARAQSGSLVGLTGGADNIKFMDKPDFTQAADIEMNRAKQSIRDTARVDEVIQGVSSQTDKTATEIKAQVASATGGFRTKTLSLEAGFYKQLGECFIKFLQIFYQDKDQVRVNGRNGVEFQMYDPGKYWGLYDVAPTLELNANAKQDEEAKKAMNFYNLAAPSPFVDQMELLQWVAEKAFDMDPDEISRLIRQPPAPPPMDPAAMGAGAPPAPGAPAGLPAGPVPGGLGA